eukprot:2006241-Rhodomonas_salina.1
MKETRQALELLALQDSDPPTNGDPMGEAGRDAPPEVAAEDDHASKDVDAQQNGLAQEATNNLKKKKQKKQNKKKVSQAAESEEVVRSEEGQAAGASPRREAVRTDTHGDTDDKHHDWH